MTLDATKRPGFLTRVGFLSTFAHSDVDQPDPARRVHHRARARHPDRHARPERSCMAAPPDGNYTTQREAIEALHGQSALHSCHATSRSIRPGFVLERYNAVGAWQDTDPLGGAINSTADVYFSFDGPPQTISTPAELMTEIAACPNAQTRLRRGVGLVRGEQAPNANDACIVNTLSTNLADASYTVASMMADYTQADSFRLRTVGN